MKKNYGVFIILSIIVFTFGCEPYIYEEPIMQYNFQKLYSVEGNIPDDVIPDDGRSGAFYTFSDYWDDNTQEHIVSLGYLDENGYSGEHQIASTAGDVELNRDFQPTELPGYFIRLGREWEVSDHLFLFKLHKDGSDLTVDLVDSRVLDATAFSFLTEWSYGWEVAVAGGRCYLLTEIGGTYYEISYGINENGFSDPRERFSPFLTVDEIIAAIDVDISSYSLFWVDTPVDIIDFYPLPGQGKSIYIFSLTERPSEIKYTYEIEFDGSLQSAGEYGFENTSNYSYDNINFEYFVREYSSYDAYNNAKLLEIVNRAGQEIGQIEIPADYKLQMRYLSYSTNGSGESGIDLILSVDKNGQIHLYSLPLEEVLTGGTVQ